jgi:nitrous oxidase accessory protein NosD
MRRVSLLHSLQKLLTLSLVAGITAACATAPVATDTTTAAPAEVAPAATSPETAQRKSPELPSSDLPYKQRLPKEFATWKKKIIYGEEVWSGDILVPQPVTITKTGTLTIAEGSTIYFDVPDNYYGVETPWLTVRGSLVIRGSEDKPVRLTSVYIHHHPNQDIVNVVAAKQLLVEHAIFERGGWGLHIHDTPARVSDSIFRDNYGGARFKSDEIAFNANRFERNRIGIRYLHSTGAMFTENTFSGNLTGIFFREGVKTPALKRNDFDNYEYDIKLGENQTINIEAGGNWWANATRAALDEFIYDGKDSEGVGIVYTSPLADKPFTLE